MRRFVGTLVLLALVASPTIARTRFFCRLSGAEITGCEEQAVNGQPAIQARDCCERRVTASPAPARIAAAEGAGAAPMLVPSLAAPPRRDAEPPRSRRAAGPSPASAGPPLFLLQGALLI